jgi:hypothetical protein
MNIVNENPFVRWPEMTSSAIARAWHERAPEERCPELSSARELVQLALLLNEKTKGGIPSKFDGLELSIYCCDLNTVHVCLWFSLLNERLGYIVLRIWHRSHQQPLPILN